ncbi:MAG: hypothetical protein JRN26_04290 [Nitrososphaerota archaeon]|nr:hypothetical protein [Nitrososphaerota archaeon]MDG6932248.1 hypothetical protein [Nitrososphaerota archaeon]MDG6936084.1 hypothetical protein [Nitrososphaerota archaeon]MDG6944711.1 hypothetical protein [Nitrososphaerota archaeon]
MIKLRNDDGIVSPLPGILGIRRKYSNEIKLADMASVASYGESSRTFRNITGIDVPKSTIHGQGVGSMIKIQGSVNKNSELDGTEAHSTGQKNSSIKVAISYDEKSHQKSLVSLSVNREWPEFPEGTASDAGREIQNNASVHQLGSCCKGHLVHDVGLHQRKKGTKYQAK